MRRSSARAQVEPLAALAATFAIGVAVALYAGSVATTLDQERDRDVAPATLDRALAAVTHDGVVDPSNVSRAARASPEGFAMNATLNVSDGERWSVGPRPPEDAEAAVARVSVRRRPGTVVSGRLRVEVWRR